MDPGFSPASLLVLVAPAYNGKEAQTENKSQSISKPCSTLNKKPMTGVQKLKSHCNLYSAPSAIPSSSAMAMGLLKM
jgi:hypothetical protein